jgi:uncharacterized protein RhaS with RHS repeats
MHARYRSPLTGRFLSTDPVLGTPALPQSWNRYAYTLGNPLRLVDPDGRSALKRGIQVLKMLADKEKRTVLIASFRSKSEREALSKTRSALDSIKGETRIVETQTAGQRDAVAKGLAPSGEMRGPESSRGYPEHVNPSDGPYSDVHVQVQGQRQAGSGRARSEDALSSAMGVGGILGGIFAPTTSALSASGDATPGELVSAAIWDATSTVDPIGLTDLIGMYYDLP